MNTNSICRTEQNVFTIIQFSFIWRLHIMLYIV